MARSVPDIFPLDKAVFGGSYNPVHRGHLDLGIYIIEKKYCRDIFFMPAGVSPFKVDDPPIRAEDRLEMIKLAIESIEIPEIKKHIMSLDIEVMRGGPSFTCDSMKELRMRFPGQKIGFVLGADSLASFEKWKNPSEILRYHPLLVLKRNREEDKNPPPVRERLLDLFSADNPVIEMVENPVIKCSSTSIRQILKEQGSGNRKGLEECLPGPVLDYVIERKLYK